MPLELGELGVASFAIATLGMLLREAIIGRRTKRDGKLDAQLLSELKATNRHMQNLDKNLRNHIESDDGNFREIRLLLNGKKGL